MGLKIQPVEGDGNCLYYATNTSHLATCNTSLCHHDDLRLLCGALTIQYLEQEDIRAEYRHEHAQLVLEAQQSMVNYDMTQSDLTIQALASIRNGPIRIIHDNRDRHTLYTPNPTMLAMVYGTEPPLPTPIITLAHRDADTDISPAHYNATIPTAYDNADRDDPGHSDDDPDTDEELTQQHGATATTLTTIDANHLFAAAQRTTTHETS